MASIFTTNMVTATVETDADSGAVRTVVKDTSGNTEEVASTDASPDITMHAADKAVLVKAGVVS